MSSVFAAAAGQAVLSQHPRAGRPAVLASPGVTCLWSLSKLGTGSALCLSLHPLHLQPRPFPVLSGGDVSSPGGSLLPPPSGAGLTHLGSPSARGEARVSARAHTHFPGVPLPATPPVSPARGPLQHLPERSSEPVAAVRGSTRPARPHLGKTHPNCRDPARAEVGSLWLWGASFPALRAGGLACGQRLPCARLASAGIWRIRFLTGAPFIPEASPCFPRPWAVHFFSLHLSPSPS